MFAIVRKIPKACLREDKPKTRKALYQQLIVIHRFNVLCRLDEIAEKKLTESWAKGGLITMAQNSVMPHLINGDFILPKAKQYLK